MAHEWKKDDEKGCEDCSVGDGKDGGVSITGDDDAERLADEEEERREAMAAVSQSEAVEKRRKVEAASGILLVGLLVLVELKALLYPLVFAEGDGS